MIDRTALVVLTTLAPISELRGGIPLGLYLGLNPFLTLTLTVFFNSIVFFPVYFGMKFFYKNLFSRIGLFNSYLSRLRKRGKPYIEKYGIWGVLLFVALPLPITGAYTGSFLSWLFDMEWRKAFLIVASGVLIAGTIVLGICLGLFNSVF